jgi:hypothetical protein
VASTRRRTRGAAASDAVRYLAYPVTHRHDASPPDDVSTRYTVCAAYQVSTSSGRDGFSPRDTVDADAASEKPVLWTTA